MEYHISDDLKLIASGLNMTLSALAEELDISLETLSRIVNKSIYPSNEIMEKIYAYAYKNRFYINEKKIELYSRKRNILLFHGSKDQITGNISLDYSRNKIDFGKGFYLGDNYEQSLDFVCETPSGSIYVIDGDYSDLKVLHIDISIDWMLLILLNRGKLEEYKNTKKYKELVNYLSRYDVVIAPIADNRMFTTIEDFMRSAITTEQATHALRDLSLGNQIVFKTEKAISQLRILERLYVSKPEKEFVHENKITKILDSERYVSDAYRAYQRKGLYISEVFSDEEK